MNKNDGLNVGLNLWLEIGDETVFCQGRALLLERIKEYGSLRQAAKSLKMSYRAAWGKLKQTQEVLGCELITLTSSRPKSYKLTADGEQILTQYCLWQKKIKKLASSEAVQLESLLQELTKISSKNNSQKS